MAAPNRKAIIEQILVKFADQITAPSSEVDGIGRRLLPHFIEAMPPEDGANWGVLEKRTSNPYSVPYDILVWKPTREHIDVLTSSEVSSGVRRLRATWGNIGPLPKPTWHWCAWWQTQTPIVPLPSNDPIPGPDPEPPPSGDVEARLSALELQMQQTIARMNRHIQT